MTAARRCAALMTMAALVLAGCSFSSVTPAATQASPPASTPVAASPISSLAAAADGLAIFGERGSAVESTEPTKLDANAALKKLNLGGLTTTTTVVTISKARVTDQAMHNRLVWIVGWAPVIIHTYGGNPPRTIRGRAATAIDANTGEILGGVETDLPIGLR